MHTKLKSSVYCNNINIFQFCASLEKNSEFWFTYVACLGVVGHHYTCCTMGRLPNRCQRILEWDKRRFLLCLYHTDTVLGLVKQGEGWNFFVTIKKQDKNVLLGLKDKMLHS